MTPFPAELTRTLSGAPARFCGGLREVAPRTWAWLQPDGCLGESNAGLIVGDGESLLVDTLWDERLTRQMLEAMTPLLANAPLRRAFITHPDGDHWWGNAVLDEVARGAGAGAGRAGYGAGCAGDSAGGPGDGAPGAGGGPRVEIVATASCDRAMHAEAPPRVLAAMATVTRAAGLLPGRAGAAARRGYAQVAPFRWREVRLRFADRTLPEAATLDVGGRAVHVRSVGPTHTASDAIVHVPDVGVVFAADILFVGVTPVMWHGPVETWLAALDHLLSLDAAVYVPGHGPPCGRAEIEELAAYWRWLRDTVRDERAAGRDAAEAARRLVRSPEHQRWASWQQPERIAINVATIYRNLDGGPFEVSPVERARLLLRTSALGHELAGG